jgi:hypothetical protein
MIMNRTVCILSLAGALVACRPAAKAPVHDTFTRVGKADAIAPLGYGQTSKVVKTRGDYGWYRFTGHAGDDVEIAVRSSDGDAVAFVLDQNDDVIAADDDVDALTSDAHVSTVLPADGTYYIAFREYSFAPAGFTVSLEHVPATCTDVGAR